MALSFAVVGPGRVGTALARLWVGSGCRCLGFAGGGGGSARAAVERCGVGRVLDLPEVEGAHVVLLTPPDSRLAAVVDRCAAAVPAADRGRLWLHTSGLFDLAVLAPLRGERTRLGSLHPLCPVPDADSGVRDLPGKPAVVTGGGRLPELLARRAGLQPVRLAEGTDRAVYHAACALAANGLTALADLVGELFERSGAGAAAGRTLATALMRAALEGVERAGPAAALSGPVHRGDVEVVRRHLASLSDSGPEAVAVYRALMQRAAGLASRGGHLDATRLEELAALLREGKDER